MTRTTRPGSGLAINPDRDLAMFADMARQGKHLTGMAHLGHGWAFTDGEPEEAVFDLAYEDRPTDDYFDIFRAAGWTPVLSLGRVHIFKAAPGTPAVHTGGDSRREELARNRDRYVRAAAIAVAVFALAALAVCLAPWGSVAKAVVLVVFVIPVVYTVIPLLGYTRRLGAETAEDHAGRIA